ncbi:MAG: hypothetical protein AAF609_16375 [Cyanobacteria bacterium P01_C01_bin.120]
MVFHRLLALVIVTSCATLLRMGLVPWLNHLNSPMEGDFSIFLANADTLVAMHSDQRTDQSAAG